MVGFNIYLVPSEHDEQTGETWDGDPVFLYLSYDTYREALGAKVTLETIYGLGRIEIDPQANHGTFMPGEGA